MDSPTECAYWEGCDAKTFRRNCAGCPNKYCVKHCTEELARVNGVYYCESCRASMWCDLSALMEGKRM